MAADSNKSLIRSCLISAKNGLSLHELEADFRTLVGGRIPYVECGFTSLIDYLKSMPDVVRLYGSGPNVSVHYVADASTAKIASLVQRQRNTTKRKPLRVPSSVVHRGPYRGVGHSLRGGARGGGRGGASVRAPIIVKSAYQREKNVRPLVAPAVAARSQAGRHTAHSMPSAAAATAAAAGSSKTTSSHPVQPAYSQTKATAAVSSHHTDTATPPRRATNVPSAPVTSPPTTTASTSALATPAAAGQSHIDTNMTTEQRFEALRKRLGLSPEVVNVVRDKKGSYYANLTVGDVSCITFPRECVSEQLARRLVYQLAVDKLHEQQQQQQQQQLQLLQESCAVGDSGAYSIDLVLERIAQVLSERPNGLWLTSMAGEFQKRFGVVLPDQWEDIAYESGRVRFDRIGADRYILYLNNTSNNNSNNNSSSTSPSCQMIPSEAAVTAASAAEAATTSAAAAAAGVNSEQLEQQIPLVELPADLCFPVYVTCVTDTARLAMIIIGDDYNERLDAMMAEMELAVSDAVVPVTPSVGQVYMALVDDSSPHRVLVTDILDTMVSAYFIDLGDTELMPIESLCQLPARFRQLPAQAVPAQLAGVTAAQLAGARHVLTSQLLNKSFMCQVVSADDQSGVEVMLYDTSSDTDVNMNQLIQTHLQTIAAPQLPAEHGFTDAFVVHVSRDEGLLYIHLDNTTVTELLQLVSTAAAAAPAAPVGGLSSGQLVLVPAGAAAAAAGDGGVGVSWRRARILSLAVNSQVNVVFIDYGSTATVSVSDLRSLPGHLHFPAQCVAVRLAGVQAAAAAATTTAAGGMFSQLVADQLALLVPTHSTRVLLRVVALHSDRPADVELFKRTADNAIVAINTTLAVACREASYTGTSVVKSDINSSSGSGGSGSSGGGSGGGVSERSVVGVGGGSDGTLQSRRHSSNQTGGVAASPLSAFTFTSSPIATTTPTTANNNNNNGSSSSSNNNNGSSSSSSGSRRSSEFSDVFLPQRFGQIAVSQLGGGAFIAAAPVPATNQSPRSPATADDTVGESDNLRRLDISQFVDGDGFMDVVVAYCSSPWNIYLQPYSQSGQLRSLMTSLQRHFGDVTRHVPLSAVSVAVGRVYAVQHHDGMWYRARLINVVSAGGGGAGSCRLTPLLPSSTSPTAGVSQAVVQFVDFGDFGHVPLLWCSLGGGEGGVGGAAGGGGGGQSRLQPLPPPLLHCLPGQAVRARLAKVAPPCGEWQTADCLYLSRLIGGRCLVAGGVLSGATSDRISGEPILTVQLVDTQGDTDRYIDRLMVESGHAVYC